MSNKARPSIDDLMQQNLNLSSHASHARRPLVVTPSNFHRRSAMAQNRKVSTTNCMDHSAEYMDLKGSLDMNVGLPARAKRWKTTKEYDRNSGCLFDEDDCFGQEEYNRITFNRNNSQKLQIHSPVNLHTQDLFIGQLPMSYSAYENDPQLRPVRRRTRMETFAPGQQGEEGVRSKESLSQAVQDLQAQNKSIMVETKRTVGDFEVYIEQLLETNHCLESNLLEYERLIESLENEKLENLQKQKQREKLFERTLKEKLALEKEIKSLRLNHYESVPSLIHIDSKQIKKPYESQVIRQQMNRKNQQIKNMQQLVSEKQAIIKKMSNFNNQMCVQVLKYKAKINDMELSGQIGFSSSRSINNSEIKSIIEQNKSLKETNQKLEKRIIEAGLGMEQMGLRLDQQNGYIAKLQKKIASLTGRQREDSSENRDNSIKFDRSEVDEAMNSKNLGKLAFKSLISQLQGSNQLEHTSNKIRIAGRSKQDGLILKKIDTALKLLCDELRNSGKKRQYKQTIYSIMRTLTEINDEATDVQQSNHQSYAGNSEQDQFFQDLQPSIPANIRFQSDIAHQKYAGNGAQKNQQIFSQIQQIKQRVKAHTEALTHKDSKKSFAQPQLNKYKSNIQLQSYGKPNEASKLDLEKRVPMQHTDKYTENTADTHLRQMLAGLNY